MSQRASADLIFIDGNIHTVCDRQPHAEAIAVKADRVAFVGSSSDARAYQDPETRVVDLAGATVLPGLTDSHCHLIGIGEREMTLSLEGAASLEDFLARIAVRVESSSRGEWITGRGWIETFWDPPVFPTRHDLDRVAPQNPVFLIRADFHGAVANSAALHIAGIEKATPDPFGGEILRGPQSGEATGMLTDAAQDLVACHITPPSKAQTEEAILLGVKRSIELGWCEIQNAGSRYSEIEILQDFYSAGKIKLRIYNAVYGPGPDADRFFREGPTINAHDRRFTTRTIKVILDGALGSRSAALLEAYSDADTSGFLTAKEADLFPMFEEALRRGIQIATHAIGDRANRTILDLYEQAFKAVPPPKRSIHWPRWRIEHAQILDPSDLPRFADLSVIPSMQPSHAISDLFFAPKRLGMKRLAGAYAWQDLINSGAIIAGGSDAPVERGDPMIEFYAAVTRKSIDGLSSEGWHTEQAVSREHALRMFTLWPAVAAFQENERGTIAVGKLADLTVLSADIMEILEVEILQTRCLMTVIGGEIVFDSSKTV
jgi:predicted amidohydrolase YtcJ